MLIFDASYNFIYICTYSIICKIQYCCVKICLHQVHKKLPKIKTKPKHFDIYHLQINTRIFPETQTFCRQFSFCLQFVGVWLENKILLFCRSSVNPTLWPNRKCEFDKLFLLHGTRVWCSIHINVSWGNML